MIATGIAATFLATLVLRPAFGGNAMYYWHYGALGRDIPQAAWHLVTHPVAAARLLITPRVKLDTMAWLAGALLFLPLLSPISLAAVPLLAERMLTNSTPDWWGLPYQYNAFVVVVLVCAAVDGAARIAGWAARARARRTLATAAAAERATPSGLAPAPAPSVPIGPAAPIAPSVPIAPAAPVASMASAVPMASTRPPGRAGGR